MTIGGIVKGMTPARYTTPQAAALVGRSVDTLRRWRSTGIYPATHKAKFGRLEVYLYSDEDIVAMRKILTTLHSGPKTGT